MTLVLLLHVASPRLASFSMVRFKNRYLTVRLYTSEVNRRYLEQVLYEQDNKTSGGPTLSGVSGLSGSALQHQHCFVKELRTLCATTYGTINAGSILQALHIRTISVNRNKTTTTTTSAAAEVDDKVDKDGDKDDAWSCVLVVRCNREYCKEVRAAITMITKVAGCKVATRVVKVNGSERTLRKGKGKHSVEET